MKLKLKAWRVQRGYSQTEISKLTGVSRQTISNWETGKMLPKLQNLKRICEILKIDLGDIDI